MSSYEWPPDDVLRAAVEKHGVEWAAQELAVSAAGLRRHLIARDLPTRMAPRKLEPSDAMKKVADLIA